MPDCEAPGFVVFWNLSEGAFSSSEIINQRKNTYSCLNYYIYKTLTGVRNITHSNIIKKAYGIFAYMMRNSKSMIVDPVESCAIPWDRLLQLTLCNSTRQELQKNYWISLSDPSLSNSSGA